jgi:iron complex outermembrane recepter protein
VTLRLTRSRDIRAPNVGDLFNGGRSNTGTVFDPSNNVTSTVVSRVGGNPALKPEKADTWGIGAVLRPAFLPALTASVDYYDIDIEDAIQSLSEQQYVDLCRAGNQLICSGIRRNAAGVIDFIAILPQNVRQQRAQGIDVEATYRMPLAAIAAGWRGALSLRAVATYVLSLKTISAQGVLEGAGVNAANGGINTSGLYAPDFKYLVSARYDLGSFAASVTMRGIGAGVYNNAFIACASACPTSTPQRPTINRNDIDAVTTFDLALRYHPAGMAERLGAEVFLTVDNLFDRAPALIAGSAGYGFYGGQDNQFSYDRLGRFFRGGVRFRY